MLAEPTLPAADPTKPTPPARVPAAPGSAAPVAAPGEVTPADATLPLLSAEEIEHARGYVDASRSQSTQKAYHGDWSRFCLWCSYRDVRALPASPALVAV